MTGEVPAVMPDVPASLPWLPRYGESSLADLGSSVLASLGAAGEPGVLGLPAADRVCVLVVDGLGWELLREHPAAAPFLSELAVGGRALSAGFPATTATSLASLGTGRPPGLHGVLGYQVAVPGQGWLLNALHWDARVDPVAWQPGSTIFERAVAAGIGAFRVGHSAFRKTGLFLATMRGAEYVSANTLARSWPRPRPPCGAATGRWCSSITVSLTPPATRSGPRRMRGGITWATSTSWPSSWRARCRPGRYCT